MDWYDNLKRFMGFSGRQHHDTQDRHWPPPGSRNDDFEPPFHSRTFSIFTDPLEIHKYFEQQMGEMLRSFGFNEFGDSSGFSGIDGANRFGFPQIEEIPDDVPSGDLRERFLKPGYEKAQGEAQDEKRDQDVDGKLDVKDWGSVFKGESSVAPYQKQVAPRRFFGQSVTSRTIRNPDGSIETHHTVRDNEGNEETTITLKVGDKEHSVTKRRDKEGKEETIENLVNLDEKDVGKFFPKRKEVHEEAWPYFDRFFK